MQHTHSYNRLRQQSTAYKLLFLLTYQAMGTLAVKAACECGMDADAVLGAFDLGTTGLLLAFLGIDADSGMLDLDAIVDSIATVAADEVTLKTHCSVCMLFLSKSKI